MTQKQLTDLTYDTPRHVLVTIAILTIAIAILPWGLQLIGVEFSSHALASNSNASTSNIVFHTISGDSLHLFLEWSAFCAALFTATLAFLYYKIVANPIVMIFGIVLFFSGCMDAFHMLAAAQVINSTSLTKDLIPFSWVVSRCFYTLSMTGIALYVIYHCRHSALLLSSRVTSIAIICGLAACAIIMYSVSSVALPQTQFPDAFITRPFDIVPLLFLLISGVMIYPVLYKKFPSHFTFALMLSFIPAIVAQLHMAFGSTRIFDSYFNIAHLIKALAYLIPFAGLLWDYLKVSNKLMAPQSAQQEHRPRTETTKLIIANLKLNLDTERLNMLHKMMGDKLFDTINIFLEEYPKITLSLKQTYQSQDFEMLERTAHSLKTSFLSFGLNDLAKIAEDIEFRAKEKILPKTDKLIHQLAEVFEQVETELNNYIGMSQNYENINCRR